MTLRRMLPWITLAAISGFVLWKLNTSHFNWCGFLRSLRSANPWLLLLAVLVILSNNLLRAVRWAVFLRPALSAEGKTVRWWALVGSQFIGFAGLAIFGRIGEMIRPLLVSRRTGLTFASQVAVVTVERVFDLGAFAMLFALNLLLSPGLQALPFHERFHTVGFVIAGLTMLIAGFVAAVRLAGQGMARVTAKVFGMISARAGAAASEKVLSFRDGLHVIGSVADFGHAAGLSLVLWASIAGAYVLVLRAFPAPVHGLTIAHILVMMGFSVVGGMVQLPGVGGGAQVGTISALTLLFGVPAELAVSAGMVLWLVTSMAVIPVGLAYARVERISIGQMAGRGDGGR